MNPVVVVAALVAVGCGEGIEPPLIDSVMPAVGPRGSEIDIHGERFCAAPAVDACEPISGSVAFGLELPQTRAVVTGWSPTLIRVTVPQTVADGATAVVVTVDGRSSNAAGFTVAP